MTSFSTGREAKQFLVGKIVEEASLEGVSLSDVERKMLYFTETAWTLPDIMEVNDEFDRYYDQNEYEKKISRLIKNAGKRPSRIMRHSGPPSGAQERGPLHTRYGQSVKLASVRG
jgi:hypothetical protein